MITPQTFASLRAAVGLPIVAIGGVNRDRVDYVKGLGADGMAVVSAVISAQDIQGAAKELVNLWRR